MVDGKTGERKTAAVVEVRTDIKGSRSIGDLDETATIDGGPQDNFFVDAVTGRATDGGPQGNNA